MECTWRDCTEEAKETLKDKNGKPWAHLCEAHFKEHDSSMEAAIKDPSKDNLKKMLGRYVRAQGGAEAAAKRMT